MRLDAVAALGAAALPAAPAGRVSRHDRADALHAEWTKLRTLPGTGWLLAAAVALTVAVSAAAAAAATCPAGGCPADPAKLSLTGVQVGQAIVAILAVLAISNEYSTGMIRVTLAAMPRRWRAGRQGGRRRRPGAGGGRRRRARLRCWPGG